MVAQPVGQSCFVDISGCKAQHKRDHLRFVGFEPESVEPQEYIHGLEGHPLVAIHEGMVAHEPKAIGGSNFRQV
jgi:hypothetical protein